MINRAMLELRLELGLGLGLGLGFLQTWYCSGSTDTIHCYCVNTPLQRGEKEERRVAVKC